MKNQKIQIKRRKKSNGNRQKRRKLTKKKPFALIPEIQSELNKIVSLMDIFELVSGPEELIDLTVVQTNFYAQQTGRNFTVDNNQLKAFLWINYIMTINKLPTIAEYWRVDNLTGNNVIQNTMI